MAIALYEKTGEKTYVSGTGVVSDHDKNVADRLDLDLRKSISDIEKQFVKEGLITPKGVKKDALQVWYRLGGLLNDIGKKYNIMGTSDEPYFWESIYHHVSPLIQRGEPPKRSKDVRRNHFRLCGYMAGKNWNYVKDVGNWAVWRDLLDNVRLQDDPRVFDWVMTVIHRTKVGHKDVRPFIHEVRRTIKNKNTSVLTEKELLVMLSPLLKLAPSTEKKNDEKNAPAERS